MREHHAVCCQHNLSAAQAEATRSRALQAHWDWEGIKTQTRARSGLQELEERFPGTKRLVPDGEVKEEMLQFIKLCALPVCLAIRN